jgi:hypothetical protein
LRAGGDHLLHDMQAQGLGAAGFAQ